MEHPFASLFSGKDRRVLGLMSGTSLDGVDVADVSVRGSGSAITWELNGFHEYAYSDGLKEVLLRNSHEKTASLAQITVLQDVIAREYEGAILSALSNWGSQLEDYDAIGSHGQTIYHQPVPLQIDGFSGIGTTQIGDPAMLAQRLGVPVVGDFRVADMALGGQGAPLVRLLINIGGIANMTVLPAGCTLDEVLAFDTGPGNMLLDAAARRYLGAAYDKGGAVADTGQTSDALLAELLSDPWFASPPPRSTGRELFSTDFAERVFERSDFLQLTTADVLATLAAFTSRTIVDSWERFVNSDVHVHTAIISGGGIRNRAIMKALEIDFGDISVSTSSEFGVDPAAKEAICFALLASETLNGTPTGVPSVTGAASAAILGKICLPSLG
jgi:anhydro-N-acetylmuramic acid kinase